MENGGKIMKALIITGKNVQDHEFIYPYYRIKEAGFEVTVALKDGEQTFGILGTKIPCDDLCSVISYENLNIGDYDLLILPGGAKSMEYLRQEVKVIKFIKEFYDTGKIIASICHAAQLLISAKVIKDHTIAGYYSIKDDILNAGALYDDEYILSGNIVSASHYKWMGEWMELVLKNVK